MPITVSEETATRLQNEGLLSLKQACKHVPCEKGNRGHVWPNTLLRWILRGKGGVKLEAVRGAGSTWYTTRPALARFMARVSTTDLQTQRDLPTQSEYERRVAEATRQIEEW